MFVVKYRKIWFALSAILLALSVWAILTQGFRFSIDFKGGTITEVRYQEARPEKRSVEEAIETLELGGFSVRPSEDDAYVIRTRELSESERGALNSALSSDGSAFSIERQNTIGPIAGAELQSKALKAIAVVVLMIVVFITFAFRKVSMPVSSWKYGLATIIALAHDVLIPTGIFVFLGKEIDILFVTGLLAILGYSVHDSIVVFDRVRENLSAKAGGSASPDGGREDFEITVAKSVNQTFARSINTSVTTFITLTTLYIFVLPVGPPHRPKAV